MICQLMNEHGLYQWKFEFDNAVIRFGCCHQREKKITMSSTLVSINEWSTVKNIVLHEIAHALVGVDHGHDKVWKAKAIEIGCTGETYYSTSVVKTPVGKYTATCLSCGHVANRQRKPKRDYSCGKCSNKFDRERLLVFIKN